MKVAVVGAGWAGLAAAVTLLRAGIDVHVLEAAGQAGGRARPVELPALGLPTDNGQHLLVGACRDTLKLMQSFGVDPQQACHVEPLRLQYADGRMILRLWRGPAPWNRLGILFSSHGLAGWRGQLHLLRLLGALRNPPPAALTVTQWLTQLGCPSPLLKTLWEPLTLAILNTPPETAQARLLARILHDSLGQAGADSHLYIPRTTLHDLWPAHACQLLGERLRRHRVRTLHPVATGGWQLDGEHADQVILAVPLHVARTLLGSLPRAAEFLQAWPEARHRAIGTVFLRLAQPWHSHQAVRLLSDDPARHAWGQWVFDGSAFGSDPAREHLVTVVIGDAHRYAGLDSTAILDGVMAQLGRDIAQPLPPIVGKALVTERRATLDAGVCGRRPGARSPWPGLLLAGDWTDTGYPSVLEGAVRSGLAAAASLLERHNTRTTQATPRAKT